MGIEQAPAVMLAPSPATSPLQARVAPRVEVVPTSGGQRAAKRKPARSSADTADAPRRKKAKRAKPPPHFEENDDAMEVDMPPEMDDGEAAYYDHVMSGSSFGTFVLQSAGAALATAMPGFKHPSWTAPDVRYGLCPAAHLTAGCPMLMCTC